MITVAILINGNPLMARSAVNTGKVKQGLTAYKIDTGEVIYHDPDKGAVVLAQMMLNTIREAQDEA